MRVKGRYVKKVIPYLLLTGMASILLYRCFFSFVWSDESFYLSLVHRFWVGDRPIVDEWSGVQFYAVALLPLYAIYRLVMRSSDGVYLFFRISMVLANYILSLYIFQTLKKRADSLPAFWGALFYLLYTRANILGASYYSFALLFYTWSLFLLLNNRDGYKKSRMLLSGFTMALSVLAIPYLGVLYVLCMFSILVIPYFREYRKNFLWMMFGTLLIAVIYCVFLLTKADLNEIIKNAPNFLNDTEHESSNIVISILLWFIRIAYRYKYMLPGMILTSVYLFFRFKKKKWLNYRTDIIYVIVNLIICAVNIIFSGDLIGCAYIAISILATNLHFLSFFYQNTFSKDYVICIYITGLLFSMIFHFASNTGLDAMTVGFSVCCTVSPLIIWESLKAILGERKFIKRRICIVAFSLFSAVVLQTTWLRLFGVYRDDSITELKVQLSEGPAKYLFTTEEHARQYSIMLETVRETCLTEKTERVVFVEMAPWAYLCVDVSCGAPSPCRFWGGLSDEKLKEYYKQGPERFPDYVLDIAPEYGDFRSVYIQGGEYSVASNGTDAGEWLIDAVQAYGYEAQKMPCGVLYKR